MDVFTGLFSSSRVSSHNDLYELIKILLPELILERNCNKSSSLMAHRPGDIHTSLLSRFHKYTHTHTHTY